MVVQLKNANEFKLFRESLLNRFQKNVRHTAFCETCFQEIPTSHVNKHRAHLEEELKVAKNKETDVASVEHPSLLSDECLSSYVSTCIAR